MRIINKIPVKKNADNNKQTSNSQLNKDINVNINRIKADFGNSDDLIVNHIVFEENPQIKCVNIYIDNLVDKNTLNMISFEILKLKQEVKQNTDVSIDKLKAFIDGLHKTNNGNDYESLSTDLLSGNTVFLINGYDKYFNVETNTSESRAINEPTSQTIIRGPKDGFTESINLNILLVRKRIKNKTLRIEYQSIGNVTKTTIGLMYITDLAKQEVVQEIKNRLGAVNIDSILDSGYIEELIKDDKYSIFPTFLSSEKPDSVTAALIEGRVAIFVDGTPYVITAPAVMVEFLQASEDYYHHFIISSTIRFLRYVALTLTLLVPAGYIAVTTFHQEMIPTALLISIAAQREGVPFPTLAEGLLMEFTFEILREAGIRMPRAIGPAISIVGALVLGQAAVEAGIISAAMVIVVSITAISSFAIPNYEMSNAIRLIRFILMLMAGFLGLYGVFMGLIILVVHLSKIKSINVPYLTPIAPRIKGGNKDSIFRMPLWKMKYRPAGITQTNDTRIDADTLPEPENNKQELT